MNLGDKVLILDFGSQFTQLIARKIREIGVYAQIAPYFITKQDCRKMNPKAIILSGGPESVNDESSPEIPDFIFSLKVPILGICYGQQALCKRFGGKVEKADKKEFGKAQLKIIKNTPLFENLWEVGKSYQVWMSHGDHIVKLPLGFDTIASSDNAPFAFIMNENNKIYAVQFHPEVVHTPQGKGLLRNFVIKIAKCNLSWKMSSFLTKEISDIKQKLGNNKVVCGISGGIDSSVVAAFISRAVGKNLYCVFVDNGLLRKNEAKEVEENLRKYFDFNLIHVNARSVFLTALKGITDPEKKRKIIGKIFIDVFYQEIQKIGDVKYLAQGTIYPDVIESLSTASGKETTIKSHHNVGGLPENIYNLKLIEPIRLLFKDEVRVLAKELNIPDIIVKRHPFPGPGLAIRIIDEVTEEKCALLRELDAIFIEELKESGLYNKVWQAYAALLPVKNVGVMGDARTYHNTCVLRAVTSSDGMTADFVHLPYDFLSNVARRIVNEVHGVSRIFYDITSKPPATIELE